MLEDIAELRQDDGVVVVVDQLVREVHEQCQVVVLKLIALEHAAELQLLIVVNQVVQLAAQQTERNLVVVALVVQLIELYKQPIDAQVTHAGPLILLVGLERINHRHGYTVAMVIAAAIAQQQLFALQLIEFLQVIEQVQVAACQRAADFGHGDKLVAVAVQDHRQEHGLNGRDVEFGAQIVGQLLAAVQQ